MVVEGGRGRGMLGVERKSRCERAQAGRGVGV